MVGRARFSFSAQEDFMSVQPIPAGYHSVTPYLIIRGAAKAIEFYKTAFGAKEVMRLPGPGDMIMHAEIQIGDSRIMMADEMKMHPGPQALGGTPVSMMLYVEDCDKVYNAAVAAGATVKRPLENQFYGDRCSTVIDPFGHIWSVATHVEDVSPEEMNRRFEAMMAAQ
jgi:PhnB protein